MAIYKALFEKLYTILALLTMGHYLGGSSRIGGTKKAAFPKICKYVLHILQQWHLAQLCVTQRKFKKYINHMTHHLSYADSVFLPKINKFCYTKKYRYTLHFNM